MKNINLLPKVPVIEKIFMPIFITFIIVFCLTWSYLYFYKETSNSSVLAKQVEITKLEAKINKMTTERQPDYRTQDYDNFTAEIRKLKDERREWIPIFELITVNMPRISRVISMAIKDTETLTVNYEFQNLKQLAEYVSLLQRSNLLNHVSVTETSQIERSKLLNPVSIDLLSPVPSDSQLSNIVPEQVYISFEASLELKLKIPVQEK